MKRREYHHHHHHHHHQHIHERRTLRTCKPAGFFSRTINGLAKKFNTSRWMIIFGFVLLFIFTHFFAFVVFFVAYLWVKNPGKYEDIFDRTVERSRQAFTGFMDGQGAHAAATAGGAADAARGAEFDPPEDEFDFQDLKRQFEDLEKRAGSMEEHVSSEEYKLRKKFEDI